MQVEAASTFDYKGKPAVQTVFWDVTERKKELDRAEFKNSVSPLSFQ